jgi:predicted transcriptional regulator
MVKNIGPFENKILDILWEKKELSAREITEILGKQGERRACSTIRTVLNRLVEKKILGQRIDKKEKIYLYMPLISKKELEKAIIRDVLSDLLKRFEKSTITFLTEELDESNKEIEKLIVKLEELKKNE